MPATIGARRLGLLSALALILVPGTDRTGDRNVDHDINRLQSTECEYRGIRANFGDLTTAYALTVFEDPELIRWTARPSAEHPDIESVVTAVYRADGIKASAPPAAPGHAAARLRGFPTLSVTWRVNVLGLLMITAQNAAAEDAINVFRHTVDSFMDQMFVVHTPTELRAEPSRAAEARGRLDHGTVLLVEEAGDGWSRVRLPATTTAGWCQTEFLAAVDNE